MLTGRPAGIWGLEDRGVLQNGNAADLIVFDPQTIGCGLPIVVNDLPDGGPRLDQPATGIRAIIVNGRVTSLDGDATAETPGLLLRSGKAA
jgi:N-acyl-D-amino-acid deacylase